MEFSTHPQLSLLVPGMVKPFRLLERQTLPEEAEGKLSAKGCQLSADPEQ